MGCTIPRAFLRYSTRVTGYVFLLADPFPPFSGARARIRSTSASTPPEPQSRLTVAFRLFLAIPALILVDVFRIVNQIVAFLGWFYCLFTGPDERGDARHQRLAPPLRGADLRLRDAAHRPLPEPAGAPTA